MIPFKSHALILSIWDFLRFLTLGIFVLPSLGSALTISGDPASNFRILLWLAAPQLILPAYLGAAAFGAMSDRGLKPLAFVGKLLSAAPAAVTLAALLAANQRQSGILVGDESELALLLRITVIILLDLIFCIILISYRSRPASGESVATAD